MSDENDCVYDKEFRTSAAYPMGAWYHTMRPVLTGAKYLATRRELTQNLPVGLRLSRLRTKKELETEGLHQMVSGMPHFIETSAGPQPYAAYGSAALMEQLGLMPALARLQQLKAVIGHKEQLCKASGQVGCKAGGAFHHGCTVVPDCYNEKPIFLSSIVKNKTDLCQEWNQINGIITQKVITHFFPEMGLGIREQQWYWGLSIGHGHENNHMTSANQVNLTDAEANIATTLKEFGQLHIDGKDDENRLTCLINLSHLDPEWYPGNFSLSGPKLTVPTETFSVVCFTGCHAHIASGMGKYPPDTPPELKLEPTILPQQYCLLPPDTPYIRLTSVNYPKRQLMRIHPDKVQGEVLDARRSVRMFGTMRNTRQWLMKYHIISNIQLIKNRLYCYVGMDREDLQNINVTDQWSYYSWADYFCDMFSWIDAETEERAYPWRREALKCLHYATLPTGEWDRLALAMNAVLCGKKFANSGDDKVAGKKSTKQARQKWTHLNQQFNFDPQEEVPGQHGECIAKQRVLSFWAARIQKLGLPWGEHLVNNKRVPFWVAHHRSIAPIIDIAIGELDLNEVIRERLLRDAFAVGPEAFEAAQRVNN